MNKLLSNFFSANKTIFRKKLQSFVAVVNTNVSITNVIFNIKCSKPVKKIVHAGLQIPRWYLV